MMSLHPFVGRFIYKVLIFMEVYSNWVCGYVLDLVFPARFWVESGGAWASGCGLPLV
ncbi:hypothetical protein Hanom_Chr17g01572051 [Helianthus anomalus]